MGAALVEKHHTRPLGVDISFSGTEQNGNANGDQCCDRISAPGSEDDDDEVFDRFLPLATEETGRDPLSPFRWHCSKYLPRQESHNPRCDQASEDEQQQIGGQQEAVPHVLIGVFDVLIATNNQTQERHQATGTCDEKKPESPFWQPAADLLTIHPDDSGELKETDG